MNVISIPAVRTQALIGFGVFASGMWLAWQVGGKIAINDFGTLEFGALGVAAFCVAITILRKMAHRVLLCSWCGCYSKTWSANILATTW